MARDFELDAADLISGPYRSCPKCSEPLFGLLQITGQSYVRRCRQCGTTREFPLWPIKKKVVFLDQFAVSNMMKALNKRVKGHSAAVAEPFWIRLFEALERAARLQLIACPSAPSHRNESLLTPYFGALRRMYEHLSHGATFDDVEQISGAQVGIALQGWLRGRKPLYDLTAERVVRGPLHEWHDRVIVTVHVDYSGDLVNGLRVYRDNVAPQLKDVFEFYRRDGTRDFGYWVRHEQRHTSDAIPKAANRYHERIWQMAVDGEFDLSKLYRSKAATDWLQIKAAVEQFGVQAEDVQRRVLEFAHSDEFLNTPYNQISIALWAAIAMLAVNGKVQPPKPSIFTDIDNIASLLPYCDAMFLDRECAGLLKNLPRDHSLPFATRIFSRANESEFFEFLQDLEAHADPEIAAIGPEIYGEHWPSAYLGMFSEDEPDEA